jgi:hypothetical protein
VPVRDHRLTPFEATALTVGAGVGAGIMAVPALADRVGLVGLAVVLPLAWAASALVHLMLAEVAFRTDRPYQVVELIRLYVLRGRWGRPLLWAVFVLLAVAIVANLAAYVAGAGAVVADLIGLPPRVAEALVYLASAGVVFFGLKAVGVAERYAAVLLVALVALVAVAAVGVPFRLAPTGGGGATGALALYGMGSCTRTGPSTACRRSCRASRPTTAPRRARSDAGWRSTAPSRPSSRWWRWAWRTP